MCDFCKKQLRDGEGIRPPMNEHRIFCNAVCFQLKLRQEPESEGRGGYLK